MNRLCEKCKSSRLRMTESHMISGNRVRRVRRVCRDCGHRHTLYEVSKEVLEELDESVALLKQLRNILGVDQRLPLIQCDSCTYWGDNGCSMDFPEAGGKFAGECSVYTSQGEEAV